MSDHRSLDERAPVTKPEPAPLRRANRRPDFQPCGGRPQVRCKSPDRVSHLEKMYRYREDILKELSSRIETELFDRLEKRSMDKIQTEKANSAIAIYSDFLQYLRVSNARHLTAFPVSDTALEFYLDHLFCKGRKKATIDRHVTSLFKWHRWLELDDFRTTYRVAELLNAMRLKTAAPQKQAEGLTADALLRAQDLFSPSILRDCGDITLLFTAFYTLCRCSELVSFDWNDFRENCTDQSGTLHLRASAVDRDHKWSYLYLSPQTTGFLKHWRNMSGQMSGKIFRCVYSNGEIGTGLSDKGVGRAFKRIARRLGLDPVVFSAHSTRVGAAREMAVRNIQATKIVNAGRWSSDRMEAVCTRNLAAHHGAAADLARMLEPAVVTAKPTPVISSPSSSPSSTQSWWPNRLAEIHEHVRNDGSPTADPNETSAINAPRRKE